jgi:NAD(P)-dependent dehydrogenase (short-subunit alcohol dehydrogenase family)
LRGLLKGEKERNVKNKWTTKDMPDQTGKTVLVTGANDGLGFLLAKHFALKSARVIMACRNAEKASRARDEIVSLYPHADIDIVKLDLSDLQSVKQCGRTIVKKYGRLDIVMCNGGIMAVPYGRTGDGIETHMGVNYYGHYALLGHLMPLIQKTPGARVVTTSSTAEKLGKLDFDLPLTGEKYNRWRAYGDSKLAMLMLAFMLDEQFKNERVNAKALSAHPGFARTNLRKTRLETEKSPWMRFQLRFYEMISMPAEKGVLPLLYAATAPELEGGEYIGVSGILQVRGHPKITRGQKRAYSPVLRKKLWEVSEQLTGVKP